MAKRYIDADLLKKEINKHYDDYRAKFHQNGERYYLGLIDGIEMTKRIIDSLQQEQPCEDLEKEIENTIDNTFCDMNGIAYLGITGYATVEDMKYIARHFYELGKGKK